MSKSNLRLRSRVLLLLLLQQHLDDRSLPLHLSANYNIGGQPYRHKGCCYRRRRRLRRHYPTTNRSNSE
jgi:hypothetical protein